MFFARRDLCLELIHDFCRDLRLNGKDIGQITIVRLRPDVSVVACVNELRVHAHFAPLALNTAFQKIGNTQGLTDGACIARDPGLVLHHRGSADYFKISNSGKVCQNFILHAISTEGVLRIRTEILKG